MLTTKAIVSTGDNKADVRQVPFPKVRDGWVIVNVRAVAINPTDWKHVAWGATDAGCRIGCDYAGIVEEVGDNVTKFKKGDRITGWIHGSNRADPESGAFAEYALAKARVQRKIPEHMSFEEAATLGVALMTVGIGMYMDLKLPLPNFPASNPIQLLIYGGSTSTGMAGIQLARLSGLTVITTCSPRNFDLVKTLGAEAVFDYKSPTCAADINAYTKNKLTYSWDCTGDGAGICAAAMSTVESGDFGSIMPADLKLLKATNPRVFGHESVVGYNTMGENYLWLGQTPTQPDQREMLFYEAFLDLTQPLLEDSKIKPLNMALNKTGDGLKGALAGLNDLENGNVSGGKLVYTL